MSNSDAHARVGVGRRPTHYPYLLEQPNTPILPHFQGCLSQQDVPIHMAVLVMACMENKWLRDNVMGSMIAKAMANAKAVVIPAKEKTIARAKAG